MALGTNTQRRFESCPLIGFSKLELNPSSIFYIPWFHTKYLALRLDS